MKKSVEYGKISYDPKETARSEVTYDDYGHTYKDNENNVWAYDPKESSYSKQEEVK